MNPRPLRRILAVEDEPDLRAVIDLCLRQVGGFELLLCPSGEAALERAVAFDPDLLLLDVMMPGMDGPATLAALRALGLTAPAFFLTAKVHPTEVADLKARGAAAVVAKPFDPMGLAAHLRNEWDTL